MQLHDLKRNHPNKSEKLVGRGKKRGKTSGRGGKGQTARAGNKKRPQMRDIIKKLPKLRGYKFKSVREKPKAVNVGVLGGLPAGTVVTPELLVTLGLVRREGGRFPKVKILGGGDLDVKLTFKGVTFAAKALEKIEKAGGTIEAK